MPAAPPRRRPPGRYDEPSRLAARALALLLAVLFAGFLAAIVWALYERYGTERVAYRARGYSVLSDRAVRIDFEVSPPADRTVWCLLRARDRSGLEVGRVFVPVTGQDGRRLVVRQELRTTGRAVTGEVPRCALVTPPGDAPTAPPAQPVSP